MEAKWTSSSEESAQSPVSEPSTEFVPAAPFTEETFGEAVEKIKQYIANGDVFQVNLSIRQDEQLHTHPYDLYKTLRQVNPSPYMSYLHTPDFQIVCGSPELLIKKKGTQLETRPIAGTRSRGKDDAEDQALAKELIENEKNAQSM